MDDVVDLLPTIDGMKIKSTLAHNYNLNHSDSLMNLSSLSKFRKYEVNRLIQDLDSLEAIFVNSEDMNNLFESYGVNSFYMG